VPRTGAARRQRREPAVKQPAPPRGAGQVALERERSRRARLRAARSLSGARRRRRAARACRVGAARGPGPARVFERPCERDDVARVGRREHPGDVADAVAREHLPPPVTWGRTIERSCSRRRRPPRGSRTSTTGASLRLRRAHAASASSCTRHCATVRARHE
jgi:hypothetical protein